MRGDQRCAETQAGMKMTWCQYLLERGIYPAAIIKFNIQNSKFNKVLRLEVANKGRACLRNHQLKEGRDCQWAFGSGGQAAWARARRCCAPSGVCISWAGRMSGRGESLANGWSVSSCQVNWSVLSCPLQQHPS